MRRQKLIVLVAVIFILYLIVIFSSAEQVKRGKIASHSLKDIYSIKTYSPLQQLAPGEIIVKFKMPISDFEMAYLISKYQSQKIGDWRSSWPSARRISNGTYVIRFPEDCSVEQMIGVFEQNPYVEYAEPNFIVYAIAYNSSKKIPRAPWKYGQLKPIREAQGEDLLVGIESTNRAGGTMRFSEARKKENMQHKGIHGKEDLVLSTSKASLKAVNKDNGIQPHPGTNDNMRVTQPSDKKRIIRSKTKIYTYRDSEGKLVVTNYYLSKSNTNKK
ncbi:MAG: hypothetical protein PVI66_09485 [Candidatus Aminicenantes bacterium]|jgi:hypothetical protein